MSDTIARDITGQRGDVAARLSNNMDSSNTKTRVLIVHNIYKIKGGEDSAVRQQQELLEKHGHPVFMYTRDNDETDTYGPLRKATFFLTSFFSLRTYREIRAIVRRFKPDVAHVHNVFPLITPAVYWALKREGVPVIQIVHNFRFMCANGLFFRDGHPCELCKTGRTWNGVRYRCYRDSIPLSALYSGILALSRLMRTWWKIDCFIALNPFTARKLVEGKITEPERIRVLGNFAPAAHRQPGSFEQRAPYVVFIGRLSVEKGVDVLIDAAARVPELGVKIIGDGPLEEELRARAASLPNVEFLGRVEGEQKFALLREARAVIFPSLCYENFSLVLLEALSVGTPIIASRLGGLPTILNEGKDSLLFTPGDAGALAELLRQVLEQPELMLQLGRHGLEVTLPEYTEARHYQRLMDIQAEVMGNSAVAR